jgi:hypothetical protein
MLCGEEISRSERIQTVLGPGGPALSRDGTPERCTAKKSQTKKGAAPSCADVRVN